MQEEAEDDDGDQSKDSERVRVTACALAAQARRSECARVRPGLGPCFFASCARCEPRSTCARSMLDEWTNNVLVSDPMRVYRAKRDAARQRVTDKYSILGFISSGTYGRVYKAQSKASDGRIHAIKKFKPDKEGDVVTYTGISQSAIREIAVRTVLSNAMSSD